MTLNGSTAMWSYELTPAYSSEFDVALMPCADSDWIRYANPIKLQEYLALGFPFFLKCPSPKEQSEDDTKCAE